MPRTCSVCQHPERQAIDKALAAGEPLRGIARTYFGTAKREDAVGRHKAEHLPQTVAKAEAARQVEQARGVVAEGLDVVGQLRTINNITLHVLKEARDAKDHDIALKAIDRVQRQIELQAKLLGELQQEGTTNIMVNAEWIEVRALLMHALGDFPEARAAVAQALLQVDHGNR